MSVPLQEEYHVGGRYLHAKTLAPVTLRYIGPLPLAGAAAVHPAESSASASAPSSSANARTEDLWLGVEYDDPSRGKHSGTFGDAKLFSTRQDGAGAFMRFRPSVLVRGKTFVQAVEERYGMINPEVHGSQRSSADTTRTTRSDRVTLGSSQGVIVVEAPGLDAVRRKVGRLERLREMGLEGEWICSVGGDEVTRRLLRERLRGVTMLDLSRNLLCLIKDVADIAACLPGLKTLVLNESRLGTGVPASKHADLASLAGLEGITELHLGRCDLTWEEACGLTALFPGLETLYLNDNPRITSLGGDQQTMGNLTTLSIEGSGVTRWEDITCGLSSLTRLATLNLSRIPIVTIPPPLASYTGSEANSDSGSHSQSQSQSFRISSLILLDSPLSDWTSVDSLAKWFPHISSLRFLSLPPSPNPPSSPPPPPRADADAYADADADPRRIPSDPTKARPFLIAKLPRLSQLNSTPVSVNERRDAELFYVGFVGRLPTTAGWARYEELCELHGRSVRSEARTRDTSSSLKARMIKLNVHPIHGTPFHISVLPSTPIALLRRKVARQARLAGTAALWTARRRRDGDDGWEKVVEVNEGAVGDWFADEEDVIIDA